MFDVIGEFKKVVAETEVLEMLEDQKQLNIFETCSYGNAKI